VPVSEGLRTVVVFDDGERERASPVRYWRGSIWGAIPLSAGTRPCLPAAIGGSRGLLRDCEVHGSGAARIVLNDEIHFVPLV
jgi:hypothetical protein